MHSAPYPFVYVLVDGSARELHANERVYLETAFHGADGNRPYIKADYQARDGWGEIAGYLKRSLLPAGVTIHPAPADDPNRPLTRAEMIARDRARGIEVIENADGSLPLIPPRRPKPGP